MYIQCFFSFKQNLGLLLVLHSTQNKHRHLAPYHFYKQPKHLLSRFASKFHQALDMKKNDMKTPKHGFGLVFSTTQKWQADSSKRLLLPILSGKFNKDTTITQCLLPFYHRLIFSVTSQLGVEESFDDFAFWREKYGWDNDVFLQIRIL